MKLTIAIPTYNRADYLDRCLRSLVRQLPNLNYDVELMVHDNASTDHTKAVVDGYIAEGFDIAYFTNTDNKGIDYNILQCYKHASGDYVVAFGDDDILYDGVLNGLDELLAQDYGIIYLQNNNIPADNPLDVRIQNDAIRFKKYKGAFAILNQINYYFTYTSACIINRKYFDVDDSYVGCFVALTPCILKAIQRAPENIYVNTPCIGFQPENSGGYKVIDVFAVNLNEVMKKEISDRRIIRCINTHLLLGFFPIWMIRFRQNKSVNSHFFKENPLVALKRVYKDRFLFKLTILPAAYLPIKLAKQHYNLCLLIKRIYTKWMEMRA